MKNLRLIALGTAAVLSLSLLAGCGGDASVSGSLSDPDTSVVAPEVSMPEVSTPDVSVPDVSEPDTSKPDESTPVTPEPEAEKTLSLNKSDFTLKAANASYKLRATVTGVEKAKVLWASSDEKIVTVAEDGTVTAVAPGTATVTATVEGTELTAKCVVRATFKVEAAPEVKPEEQPQQPAPETKPEEKPEQPAPEVPAVDHTSRYVSALKASKCELLEYNPPYTDGSADAAAALEYVGLAPGMVTDFAVSFSMMNTKAFGLAAVMPTEGQQQAVVAGLNSFVARIQQAFNRYLPDQYEIAKAAKVVTLSDGTVLLVMCEGQDTALANIKAALG